MNENLTIQTERVDDIPVLLTQQKRMGLSALLDEHFPTHGNWEGLSLGEVTVGWLTHILSEADHRLNQVQSWVAARLETLSLCLGQPVRALDWSDDRLEEVLRALSDGARWIAFEGDLTRSLLRVYDLPSSRVRLDSTSCSGYWSVTPDGLFQRGHSKDHRPDLPQVKVMLAALDPLGMPVATEVVSGERADDPLYLPTIKRVRQHLGRRGLLYVGDCKMAAVETRAVLHGGGDFYLCPLSLTQLSAEELESYLAPVWSGKQPLMPIERTLTDGTLEQIAEGYELLVPLSAVVDGQSVTWIERRLVVRSLMQVQTSERALRARLAEARSAVLALNEHRRGKRRFTEATALRQAVNSLLSRYRVEGLLQVTYEDLVTERSVRRYGNRPATVRVEHTVRVSAIVDEKVLSGALQRLGWRVYATNQPADQLALTQAVLAYRQEYLIERDFGRLKGKPLSLSPMYLERDDHATGLIRLLSIGLRVLTLLEFEVRRQLAKEEASLAGLYAGNPKRATIRPTAERLLEAFQNITLTVIQASSWKQQHLTPLSEVQQRILSLLGFPLDIYARLCSHSSKPP